MPLRERSEAGGSARASPAPRETEQLRNGAQDRNQDSLRHSMRDGIAFSVMAGAGETYLSAYALFLKATAEQIAWLASIPPLIGSALQLLSAWLGGRGTPRKQLILVGAFAQGLIWLPLVALPLLWPAYAIPILIGCVAFYHACANFIQPQWSSLMRDLVAEDGRGRYFGHRTRIASLTAFIALVAAGGVLAIGNRMEATLAGFAVVFCVAAIARFVSVYHLGHMHDPETAAGRVKHARIFTGMWRSLKFLRGSHFLHFSLFFACMQGAVAIASPFFTLYMLRDLGYGYGQFMAASATAVVMQILTLNTWGRISDLFGNRLVLAVTGWMIPVVPALWVVSTNFWYLLAVQAVGGLAWAGFSLSAGNFLYDLRPGARHGRAQRTGGHRHVRRRVAGRLSRHASARRRDRGGRCAAALGVRAARRVRRLGRGAPGGDSDFYAAPQRGATGARTVDQFAGVPRDPRARAVGADVRDRGATRQTCRCRARRASIGDDAAPNHRASARQYSSGHTKTRTSRVSSRKLSTTTSG